MILKWHSHVDGTQGEKIYIRLNNADITEAREWQSIEHTIMGYEAFLQKYPTGRYADRARKAISSIREAELREAEELDYRKAWTTNTIVAYEAFLQKHPKGMFAQIVRELIAELSDWQKAQAINTVVAYQAFLKKHPEGRNTKEAHKRIDELLDSRGRKP